jgi:hypothetical protein
MRGWKNIFSMISVTLFRWKINFSQIYFWLFTNNFVTKNRCHGDHMVCTKALWQEIYMQQVNLCSLLKFYSLKSLHDVIFNERMRKREKSSLTRETSKKQRLQRSHSFMNEKLLNKVCMNLIDKIKKKIIIVIRKFFL